jgi:hypothetical protein
MKIQERPARSAPPGDITGLKCSYINQDIRGGKAKILMDHLIKQNNLESGKNMQLTDSDRSKQNQKIQQSLDHPQDNIDRAKNKVKLNHQGAA